MTPKPNRIPLDRPVVVVEDLPTWAFMGGWGDGPHTLTRRGLIYLDYQQGDEVFFIPGVRRPPLHSLESSLGGVFDAAYLPRLQDLAPPPGSGAALARGCTCPAEVNQACAEAVARGAWSWTVTPNCPLHDHPSASFPARAAGCRCPALDDEDCVEPRQLITEDCPLHFPNGQRPKV